MAKEEEEKRLESLVEQSKAPDSEEVKEAAANSPEDSKQENIEANELMKMAIRQSSIKFNIEANRGKPQEGIRLNLLKQISLTEA